METNVSAYLMSLTKTVAKHPLGLENLYNWYPGYQTIKPLFGQSCGERMTKWIDKIMSMLANDKTIFLTKDQLIIDSYLQCQAMP